MHPRYPLFSLTLLVALSYTRVAAQPGTNDNTFNPTDAGYGNGDGCFGNEVIATALQDDGKVLLGGDFTAYDGVDAGHLVRLNADGSRDTSFDVSIGADAFVASVVIQSDGRILIAGAFTFYNGVSVPHVARLEADGDLDPTFVPVLGVDMYVTALALQPDGRVVIGGGNTDANEFSYARVLRLETDGSLDTSFHSVSTVPVIDYSIVQVLALQADGKVLAGGSFTVLNDEAHNRLVRLDQDGTTDTTFDAGTGADATVFSLLIQPDDKVLVGGTFSNFNGTAADGLVRLMGDGSMDATFNIGTGFSDSFGHGTVWALAQRADGRIVTGGEFTLYDGGLSGGVAQLLPDGTVDPAFAVGLGFQDQYYVYSLALDANDKVVVGGYFNSYRSVGVGHDIARLNTDASLDNTFHRGSGANGLITAIAPQMDGKVLVAGAFTLMNAIGRNHIARILADGSVDPAFDPGIGFHLVSDLPFFIALQPDGKAVVAGGFDQFNGVACDGIVRLNTDGTRDLLFTGAMGSAPVAIQSDGKIMVGRHRLNSDGSLDGTFDAEWISEEVRAVVIQPDGKILLAGGTYINQPALFVRVNADGSADPAFAPGADVPGGPIRALALRPDGRMVIGGMFTTVGAASRSHISQALSNGGLDASFDPGTGFSHDLSDCEVPALALQPDGRVLAVGRFTDFDGVPRNGIARIETDGSLDASFDPGTGFYVPPFAYTTSVALQADGKVLVGGDFTSFNGIGRNRIARLMGGGNVCAASQLTTSADPVISCGATNLKFDGSSTITATEVSGANKYQFHFTNITGQPAYVRSIAFTQRSFTLAKWYTNPLKAGRSYIVMVRASFDGGATWCPYGPSCTVQVSSHPLPPAMEERSVETDPGPEAVLVYPNPNRGDALFITFVGHDAAAMITVDISDALGQRVLSRTLAAEAASTGYQLPLEGILRDGPYVVTITSGDQVNTEHMVIAGQ